MRRITFLISCRLAQWMVAGESGGALRLDGAGESRRSARADSRMSSERISEVKASAFPFASGHEILT
jgi:hypothetical protein